MITLGRTPPPLLRRYIIYGWSQRSSLISTFQCTCKLGFVYELSLTGTIISKSKFFLVDK